MESLLLLPNVRSLLQQENLIQLFSDINIQDDRYIPTLQYLVQPDHLQELVALLLEEPHESLEKTIASTGNGQYPVYSQYSFVYKAQWLLCSSTFSHGIISAILSLNSQQKQTLQEFMLCCNTRDTMVTEAFTRFLSAIIDQHSVIGLVTFFEDRQEELVETLLVQLYYESVREVLVLICTNTSDTEVHMKGFVGQLLHQLSPQSKLLEDTSLVSSRVIEKLAKDEPHHTFSRVMFTCDFITDIIHEKRTGSIGWFYVNELMHNETYINHFLDAVVWELTTLPTFLANESYAVKVLNTLLQQSQCGCVTKLAFTGRPSDTEAWQEQSPHVDLSLLWKKMIERLPELLQLVQLPLTRSFRPTLIQVIYLILPIVNCSCYIVDQHLIKAKTFETLIEVVLKYPRLHIVHSAVVRLFILSLEDAPFMFGKELPVLRTGSDPLRLHLLLQGCLELLLSSYEKQLEFPPAFTDISISFDQALTAARANLTQPPHHKLLKRWQRYRSNFLLPIQMLWENQVQEKKIVSAPPSPKHTDSELETLPPTIFTQDKDSPTKPTILCHSHPIQGLMEEMISTTEEVVVSDELDHQKDSETPLSALYDDEERMIMEKVVSEQEQRTVITSNQAQN